MGCFQSNLNNIIVPEFPARSFVNISEVQQPRLRSKKYKRK